jgi:hypothetical protein
VGRGVGRVAQKYVVREMIVMDRTILFYAWIAIGQRLTAPGLGSSPLADERTDESATNTSLFSLLSSHPADVKKILRLVVSRRQARRCRPCLVKVLLEGSHSGPDAQLVFRPILDLTHPFAREPEDCTNLLQGLGVTIQPKPQA